MLPSKGVSGLRPTAGFRHCLAGSRQTAASWQISSRQFSQARRPNQSLQQWKTRTSALRGQGSTLPRLVPTGRNSTQIGIASGASRSLSLWPLWAKQDPTATAVPSGSTPPSLPTSAPPSKLEPTPTGAHLDGQVATQAPGADLSSPLGTSVAHSDPISSSFTAESFGDLDATSILDIPEQIGYLKQLGLDFGWGPTAVCEWLLEHIYIYSGLPWWGAIAVAAVGFRLVMFWPSMNGAKHGARMAVLQKDPEFIKANAEVKQLMWQPDQDRMEIMKARSKISRMTKKAGVSMAKTLFAPVAIVPFSFGMFRLLRSMTTLPVPSLETGGFAWITDLTVYDPTYLLPLTTAALSAITMRQHQLANLNPTPASQAVSKFMMLGMTPIMVLCTMWFPAGVQWFFFSFALTSVVQSSVVLIPAVRRWFELPPLSSKTPLTPLAPSEPAAGAQYQAPSRGIRGLLDGASKNIEGMTSGLKEYTGGDAKASAKKAQEYEKRRAQEEKEKALNRMIEQRQKKLHRRESRT